MIVVLIFVYSKYPACPIQTCGLASQGAEGYAIAQYSRTMLLGPIVISSGYTDNCPSETSSPQPRLASSATHWPSRLWSMSAGSRSPSAHWTVAPLFTTAYPQTPAKRPFTALVEPAWNAVDRQVSCSVGTKPPTRTSTYHQESLASLVVRRIFKHGTRVRRPRETHPWICADSNLGSAGLSRAAGPRCEGAKMVSFSQRSLLPLRRALRATATIGEMNQRGASCN
ncbi:hypothetical protein FIBSPDRAFT_102235 [Athelia psychrophila]|uniref:Uncharacterized protein n=1 Tax=Athelia psychrophila TaxID=1759441 RepID=A0A166DHR7_9AGAM|nr:hypothetical protein FIBSPDRAFT_102235 [Fibularhizoctonia sp. CBS 109695]